MNCKSGLVCLSFGIILTACGGGGGGSTPTSTVNCETTAADSSPNLAFIDGRIRSHNNGTQTYGSIPGVRFDESGNAVFIDYMVHEAVGTAKALLVLIPGGNGNARIEGTNGASATSSGGNFLIRSAHLFAAQGYKVVSVDRPSDYEVVINSSAYDGYRNSNKHAVDLTRIINWTNTENLPVIIAGTSRGAISAVAQAALVDAIAISSPVTTKNEGDIWATPVSEDGPVKPSSVSVPAHVFWHVDDACGITKPADSEAVVADFNPDAASNSANGGFAATDGSACGASTAHGFYGVESCAVGISTNWMDGLSLPASRPIREPGTPIEVPSVNAGGTVNVQVGQGITAANNGSLSYSLPHTKTSMGGTVSITGNTVTYTAPTSVATSTQDTFVFVVSEAGGGKRPGFRRVVVNP